MKYFYFRDFYIIFLFLLIQLNGFATNTTPLHKLDMMNCNGVTVAGNNGAITISKIPAGAKVEILGPSTGWAPKIVCEGNCNATKKVNNLTAGEYTIKVQAFNPYCFKEYKVQVNGGSGNGGSGNNNCNVAPGTVERNGCGEANVTITYGNNSISLQSPSRFASQIFNANGTLVDDCNRACPNLRSTNGIPAGKYRVIIRGQNNQIICDEEICVSARVNPPSGGGGSGNGGGGNGGNCNNVTVAGNNGAITISKIPAGAKVEILGPSTGWAPKTVCEGNCNATKKVNNLTAGEYTIKVQAFNPYCFKEYKVQIRGGSSGSRNSNLVFFANEANRQVSLQWATNNTFRNDYYVIEKSTDGTHFEPMNQISNHVFNDLMETFSHFDEQPTLGTNYYRLREVHFDGSTNYSAIQEVDFNIDLEKIAVFPNPAHEAVFINLASLINQEANITISNKFGQIVKTMQIKRIEEELLRVDLQNVPNGLYLITIQPSAGKRMIGKKLFISHMY